MHRLPFSSQKENMMNPTVSNCARCPYKLTDRLCRTEDGKAPEGCPTADYAELSESALAAYDRPDTATFARNASIQEAEGYADREKGYDRVRPAKTRIEEIMAFAGRMGYRRLGMAFCLGLRKEAAVVASIFSGRGFEMVSAVCKAGRVPKERIGVRDDQKIAVGQFEAMCNPILQAMILNEQKTELNVMLGLCVGHDSLFLKHADAPCTVLAVKDRLLGHNPLAAVYNAESYYRCLKVPEGG